MTGYSMAFEDALTTGFLSAASVLRGASKRAYIDDLLLSINGTMSDEVADWRLRRLTVDGTGTATFVNPNDPDDGPAVTTGKEGYTIEGTITADSELLEASIHRRAAYRWIAKEGRSLIVPNTAAAGIVIEALAPSAAGNIRGTVGLHE